MSVPRSVLFPTLETVADPAAAAKYDITIARYMVDTAKRELADMLEYWRDTRGHPLRSEARRRVLLAIGRVRNVRDLYRQAIMNRVGFNMKEAAQ